MHAFLKPYTDVPRSSHLPAIVLITGHATRRGRKPKAESKIPGLNQAFEVSGSWSQMRETLRWGPPSWRQVTTLQINLENVPWADLPGVLFQGPSSKNMSRFY